MDGFRRRISGDNVDGGNSNRRHPPRRVTVGSTTLSLRPLALILTTLVAALVTLAVLGLPRASRHVVASSVSATTQAQQILDSLLSSQPLGKVTSATFVETTVARYVEAEPPESAYPNPELESGDPLIIIKVVGTFPSAHSGPAGANTDASIIVVAYDERLGKNVGVTYVSAPISSDFLSGAPSVSLAVPFELSKLGTPQSLWP